MNSKLKNFKNHIREKFFMEIVKQKFEILQDLKKKQVK